MPSGSHAPLPVRVLVRGHAEQHDRGDAEVRELAHLLAQRLTRVLHDAGQRGDRLWLVDAFTHEERRDEVVDAQLRLGDETAERGRAPEPAGPARGEGHPRILRAQHLDQHCDHRRDRVLVGHRGDGHAQVDRRFRGDRSDAHDHRRHAVDARSGDERGHRRGRREEDRVARCEPPRAPRSGGASGIVRYASTTRTSQPFAASAVGDDTTRAGGLRDDRHAVTTAGRPRRGSRRRSAAGSAPARRRHARAPSRSSGRRPRSGRAKSRRRARRRAHAPLRSPR